MVLCGLFLENTMNAQVNFSFPKEVEWSKIRNWAASVRDDSALPAMAKRNEILALIQLLDTAHLYRGEERLFNALFESCVLLSDKLAKEIRDMNT
jgi:hypothetical protein